MLKFCEAQPKTHCTPISTNCVELYRRALPFEWKRWRKRSDRRGPQRQVPYPQTRIRYKREWEIKVEANSLALSIAHRRRVWVLAPQGVWPELCQGKVSCHESISSHSVSRLHAFNNPRSVAAAVRPLDPGCNIQSHLHFDLKCYGGSSPRSPHFLSHGLLLSKPLAYFIAQKRAWSKGGHSSWSCIKINCHRRFIIRWL